MEAVTAVRYVKSAIFAGVTDERICENQELASIAFTMLCDTIMENLL